MRPLAKSSCTKHRTTGHTKSQVFTKAVALVNTWVVTASVHQPATCISLPSQVVISRQYLGKPMPW
jgi:hypothetical protein